MDGVVLGGEVGHEGLDDIGTDGGQKIAEEGDHVAEGLQSLQVNFTVAVCQAWIECIKHLQLVDTCTCTCTCK